MIPHKVQMNKSVQTVFEVMDTTNQVSSEKIRRNKNKIQQKCQQSPMQR